MSVVNLTPTDENVAFAAGFAPLWERAKAYTLDMAEAMPEEHYDYAVAAEVRTFAQQLVHTGQAMNMLCAGLLLDEQNPLPDGKAVQTKEQVKDFLTQSFDYVAASVNALPQEELSRKVMVDFLKIELTKKEIVYFIRDHTTHHRSQTLVYLRAKGIKPPQYRGW
jgi:uncharacterized damage-inducible protein DinB